MNETQIKPLERIVASPKTQARHFTFELPGDPNDQLDPDHRELGLNTKGWRVLLGDLGILFCEDTGAVVIRLFVKEPDFTLMFKELPSLARQLKAEGFMLTEPVTCWLRGLLHALIAEKPNVIECNVVMTGTSSTHR